MAFLNKVSANDLKELGLDPEELKAQLKKIEDGSATKAEITAVTEAMTALKTSIEGIDAKFTTALEGLQKPPAKPIVKPEGNEGDDDKLDAIDFMNDPAGNIKKTMKKETDILRLQNLKLYSDMAYENTLRDTDKFPLFKRFKDEIDKKWNEVDLQFKTQPAKLIENIYKIVVADHLDELNAEAAKNNGRYNLGSSGTSGGGQGKQSNTPVKTAAEQLSPKELEVARKMGLTPEEYLKEKEAINVY